MTHKQRKVATGKSDVVRDLPLACSDESAAVAFLEGMRWGEKPACPRCGSSEVRRILGKDGQHAPRFLWRCYGCKRLTPKQQQFTWRIGTVAEDSRIPARCWTYALWRANTSKKGVAALEIKRQTGLSYKSALFLMHRIRFAMATNWTTTPPMEGTVISDETVVGGKPRHVNRGREHYHARKSFVVALVEKGGEVRAMTVPNITAATVGRALRANVSKAARLHTDESSVYDMAGRGFAAHETVNHKRHEYVRGDVTTNHAEGWFSLLKRGLDGIYHSVSRQHLHRYVAEFEFRYNHRGMEDGERVRACLVASQGKRLRYKELPNREIRPRPTLRQIAKLKPGERVHNFKRKPWTLPGDPELPPEVR